MLLFSTGLIYEVTRQDPTSYFLNNSIDGPYFQCERGGWGSVALLGESSDTGTAPVYTDVYRSLLLSSIDSNNSFEIPLTRRTRHSPRTSFWGRFNLLTGTTAQESGETFLNGTVIYHASLAGIADTRNRIF